MASHSSLSEPTHDLEIVVAMMVHVRRLETRTQELVRSRLHPRSYGQRRPHLGSVVIPILLNKRRVPVVVRRTRLQPLPSRPYELADLVVVPAPVAGSVRFVPTMFDLPPFGIPGPKVMYRLRVVGIENDSDDRPLNIRVVVRIRDLRLRDLRNYSSRYTAVKSTS